MRTHGRCCSQANGPENAEAEPRGSASFLCITALRTAIDTPLLCLMSLLSSFDQLSQTI